MRSGRAGKNIMANGGENQQNGNRRGHKPRKYDLFKYVKKRVVMRGREADKLWRVLTLHKGSKDSTQYSIVSRMGPNMPDGQ